MKKFLALILSLITCFAFVACNPSQSSESIGESESIVKDNLTFYAPDGAPALAIAKFVKDGENFGMNADITYNVVDSSKIGPSMAKGDGDFMVIPVNAASKLYKSNSKDPYVMTAVVTHGNLYIASTEDVTLEGLKGKVIGVIGQGLVPDLTLRAILKDKGLLDSVVEGNNATEGKITIKYFAQASDMLPLLKQGKLSIGLLPEPALTKLTTKLASEKNWKVLDVQELYDAENKSYPQAVLMVKKSVYTKYKAQIDAMSTYFADNLTWIKANTEEAVNAITSALPKGVTPSLDASAINATVIDNCKIYYQVSADAKEQVKEYINKLIAVNPDAAKAVADDFFA